MKLRHELGGGGNINQGSQRRNFGLVVGRESSNRNLLSFFQGFFRKIRALFRLAIYTDPWSYNTCNMLLSTCQTKAWLFLLLGGSTSCLEGPFVGKGKDGSMADIHFFLKQIWNILEGNPTKTCLYIHSTGISPMFNRKNASSNGPC